MALVSVITPVAPYHLSHVERVKALVSAQSIPCEHIIIIDETGRGAGWGRNRGVELAQTPFITFLDADDIITPDYAEKMLSCWERGYYVYSDWLMSGEAQVMTDYGGLWNGLHHLINCLMLKADFESLGGFNEHIEAEDTEFWLRSHHRGLCGKRSPYVLVEYTGDGLRSKRAQLDPDFWTRLAKMYKELMPMNNSNCGGCQGIPATPPPKGERQSTDVLVVTLWGGNSTQVGRVTGRVYPRNGNGGLAWIDPRDLEAAPALYRAVDPIEPAALTEDTKENVKAVLDKAARRGKK